MQRFVCLAHASVSAYDRTRARQRLRDPLIGGAALAGHVLRTFFRPPRRLPRSSKRRPRVRCRVIYRVCTRATRPTRAAFSGPMRRSPSAAAVNIFDDFGTQTLLTPASRHCGLFAMYTYTVELLETFDLENAAYVSLNLLRHASFRPPSYACSRIIA